MSLSVVLIAVVPALVVGAVAALTGSRIATGAVALIAAGVGVATGNPVFAVVDVLAVLLVTFAMWPQGGGIGIVWWKSKIHSLGKLLRSLVQLLKSIVKGFAALVIVLFVASILWHLYLLANDALPSSNPLGAERNTDRPAVDALREMSPAESKCNLAREEMAGLIGMQDEEGFTSDQQEVYGYVYDYEQFRPGGPTAGYRYYGGDKEILSRINAHNKRCEHAQIRVGD